MGPGDTFSLIAVVSTVFVALPWIIFHYVTQWKKAGGSLTAEDEKLLDDLHDLGRRLDDRVATIERIMTAENPGWRHLGNDPTSIGIEDRKTRSEGSKFQ